MKNIVLIGDSIVALLFTNGVSVLQAGGNVVSSIAVAGHTVANQITAWQASPLRGDLTQHVCFIQVGVNDIRTAVALATTLANLATLITDIRTNNPGMVIMLCLMTPARTDASVLSSYNSKYLPIQAAILAAGTGTIPAVDRIVTSANAALNDGTDALLATFDSGDHLHPSAGGNRLNAVEFRANLNAFYGLTDPVPVGGISRGQVQSLGQWSRVNMPASTTLVVSRGTSEATAVQVRRRCKIRGFTHMLANLGAGEIAAGAALTVRVVRVTWQGVDYAPVTIGTIEPGEASDYKTALTEVQLEAGDLVYVQFVTTAGWTSVTADPAVCLITEEN